MSLSNPVRASEQLSDGLRVSADADPQPRGSPASPPACYSGRTDVSRGTGLPESRLTSRAVPGAGLSGHAPPGRHLPPRHSGGGLGGDGTPTCGPPGTITGEGTRLLSVLAPCVEPAPAEARPQGHGGW